MNLNEILKDETLYDQFIDWSPSLEAMAGFCRMVDLGFAGEDVLNMYGPEGITPIDWTALGLARPVWAMGFFVEYGDEVNVHAEGIVRRTMWDIREQFAGQLEPYAESFEYSLSVDEPTNARIGVDDIDWATVQAVNQTILKDLAEGDSVVYWQCGGYLIIGQEQSQRWRMVLEELNGYEASGEAFTGWILMYERGGMTSRGRIEVNGCPDEAAFKATLRQFSNKEIDFQ